MTHFEDQDIWLDAPQAPEAIAADTARTQRVDDLGVPEQTSPNDTPRAWMPDALQPFLFAPPTQTYALLDGAQIQGLPERLTVSGLDHACLFTGKSADAYRAAAPWLVRLEPDHSFTRRLFTPGIPGSMMWDRNAYIFLQSEMPLQALTKHLRKFLKYQDGTGGWLFFRLYDPDVLGPYLEEADASFLAGLFHSDAAQHIARCLFRQGDDWFAHAAPPPHPDARKRVDAEAAGRIAIYMAADRELGILQERGALENATVPADQHQRKARAVLKAVYPLGFKGRFHIRYFIAWQLIYGRDLLPLQGEIHDFLHDTAGSVDARFQSISELIRSRLGQRMGALFG